MVLASDRLVAHPPVPEEEEEEEEVVRVVVVTVVTPCLRLEDGWEASHTSAFPSTSHIPRAH